MFNLQINEVKLVSAVGIDYSKLRNLLAAKKVARGRRRNY